jgi:hypothetical protein
MPGFGKNDLLTCPECGKEMRLIRRSPHPVHGEAYEAQIFACDDGHEITRSADMKGDPHSDAAAKYNARGEAL